MLDIRPFRPQDILLIDVQKEQREDWHLPPTIAAGESLVTGLALSAWDDGICIGAAGVLELWPNRAMAWCRMSVACGRHLWPLTKIVREALAIHPADRIEMTAMADFPRGIRWAKALGFVCETPEPMKKFVNGRDAYLFARVR